MFGLPIQWARRILVLSLVLNFLVIGAVIGIASKPTERRWGTTSFITQTIMDLTNDEARAEMRERLLERRDNRSERRRAGREAWEKIIVNLRQTPYDAAQTSAIFDEMRDLRSRSRSQTQAVITDAIAAMSDAERAELAKRLESFLEEREKRR